MDIWGISVRMLRKYRMHECCVLTKSLVKKFSGFFFIF